MWRVVLGTVFALAIIVFVLWFVLDLGIEIGKRRARRESDDVRDECPIHGRADGFKLWYDAVNLLRDLYGPPKQRDIIEGTVNVLNDETASRVMEWNITYQKEFGHQ